MSGTLIQFILIALSVLVNVFILFNFCDRMFPRAYQSRLVYIVVFLFAWVLITSINLFGYPQMNILIYAILLFSLGTGLFGVTKGSDILYMSLLLLFLLSVETASQLMVSLVFATPFSIPTGNVAQTLITFFSYQIVMYFIDSKKAAFQVPGHWITLIIIPSISLYLIYAIINLLTLDSSYTQVVLATSACLLVFVTNIVVYFLFSRLAELDRQNEQNKMMIQQSQQQYRYFNDLEQKYDASRKLYHDIKNHMNALEQMYKGQTSGIKEYSETLHKRIDALSVPLTGSRVLNILFADRTALAEAYNITFDINCEDIDLSFISEFDLTTIMANLLDNAFDECKNNHLPDNFIEINICQINCFIVFLITNSCEKPPRRKGSRYLSGKTGHSGLGLLNVQETVETQYEGTINTGYADNVFTVQITFPGRDDAL